MRSGARPAFALHWARSREDGFPFGWHCITELELCTAAASGPLDSLRPGPCNLLEEHAGSTGSPQVSIRAQTAQHNTTQNHAIALAIAARVTNTCKRCEHLVYALCACPLCAARPHPLRPSCWPLQRYAVNADVKAQPQCTPPRLRGATAGCIRRGRPSIWRARAKAWPHSCTPAARDAHRSRLYRSGWRHARRSLSP